MRNVCFTVTCFFLAELLLPASLFADWVDGKMTLKHEDAVTPAVRPFPLESVRLAPCVFRDVQELERAYLRTLSPDRFLVKFRSEAGLPAKPGVSCYGGWEANTPLAGHSLGHYLSAASKMYAATGDSVLKKNVDETIAGLAEVQAVYGQEPRWTGYLSAIPKGKELFEATAAGDVERMGHEWIVPFYTQHKILAGLLDAWRYCGNAAALTLAERHADWMIRFFNPLSDELFQRMLRTEFGGIAMPLAELYSITGERKYLDFVLRFQQKSIVEPWEKGVDNLRGIHANTQIPKAAVCAKLYEITGDETLKNAAEFFWKTVVFHHSYVTGGNSDREHFGAADHLDGRFEAPTETCNTYNMLKLTEHIYRWNPDDPACFDFYERALYNHILGAFNHHTHPEKQFENGLTCYFIHFRPGDCRRYEPPYDAFTCCFGTGMENPSQYNKNIYWHSLDDETLYVNLFIPSQLKWPEKGLSLTQTTRFPEDGDVTLTLKSERDTTFQLKVRVPFWTGKTGYETFPIHLTPNTEKTVTVRYPMALRTESIPDNPQRVALFYGPTLLTADMGPTDCIPTVPALVSPSSNPSNWIVPVEGEPLHFVSRPGAFTQENVRFMPFYALHERRNAVFFDHWTPEQWEKRKSEIAEAERQKQELAARCVDSVSPGEMQSERDHHAASENSSTGTHLDRKYRHAFGELGWFSYEIAVDSDCANELACDFWGSDGGKRTFFILVDGTRVAEITLNNDRPMEFFTKTIPLPQAFTAGKKSVTVKFQPKPEHCAGGVFGIRTYRVQK